MGLSRRSVPNHRAALPALPRREVAFRVPVSEGYADEGPEVVKPAETNIQGAGLCRMCGWGIDVHPLDAELVDVGRCPTPAEQTALRNAPDLYSMLLIVRDFPPAGLR
jgi:hypothetical protein